MKETPEDPVISEMHDIKDANAAHFKNNLQRMFAHWQTIEHKNKAVSASLTSKRPVQKKEVFVV